MLKASGITWAEDPFTAFHLDKTLVRKHMAPLLIGELAPDQPSFEPDKNSQAGYLQHDLGHLSVFSNPKWNHLFHEFVMCYLKGFSASWWSSRHSMHHAKPNCFRKDPDIAAHPFIFSLGEPLSLELGLQKKKYMPYNYQHKYFPFIMPLIVMSTFQGYSFYNIFQRKLWREMAWILAYFIRIFIVFNPILGFKGVLGYLFLLKFLESILFTWITQMNHIPMHIDYDKNMDWFSTQLQATCNVNQSFFNDWLTGHLNFQIEHHLFPVMPRHNFWKVAPLVKSMCTKHGIAYQSKPLSTGFADIVRSLKVAGEIWFKAYHLEQKTQNPKICLQQRKKDEETR